MIRIWKIRSSPRCRFWIRRRKKFAMRSVRLLRAICSCWRAWVCISKSRLPGGILDFRFEAGFWDGRIICRRSVLIFTNWLKSTAGCWLPNIVCHDFFGKYFRAIEAEARRACATRNSRRQSEVGVRRRTARHGTGGAKFSDRARLEKGRAMRAAWFEQYSLGDVGSCDDGRG